MLLPIRPNPIIPSSMRFSFFFKAVTTAANDLGVKLGWELTEVPDVQQDGYTMSRIAAEALYWKK